MSTYSLNFKELSKVMGTRGNRDLDNNSISVRGTLEPVARDEANVEVEKDETVLTYLEGDPIPTFYRAGGKRHSNGGTPLNLPPDSFVFSDTSSMKLTGEVLKDFGFNPKKKYTPAELSYQYDINKYRKTLVDPLSDEIDRLTAELMISNNINKLGKLALLQESKKGFPQGIPVVAMPYVMTAGLDPSMFIPSEYTQDGLPMARKGGSYGNLPKYQDRGELQRTLDAQSEQSEPYEQNWRRLSGKRIKNFFDDPYLADKTLAGMDFITGMNERAQTAKAKRDFQNQFFSGNNIYGPLAENQDRGDYMVHSPYMLRPTEYTPVQFPGNLDPGIGIAKQGGALRRVRLLPRAQAGIQQSMDPKLDQNNLQPTKKVRVTPGFGGFFSPNEENFKSQEPAIYETFKTALESNDINKINLAIKDLDNVLDKNYFESSELGRVFGSTLAGVLPWTTADKTQDLRSILNEKKQELIGKRTQTNYEKNKELGFTKYNEAINKLKEITNTDLYKKLTAEEKNKLNMSFKDLISMEDFLGQKQSNQIRNAVLERGAREARFMGLRIPFTEMGTDYILRQYNPSLAVNLANKAYIKPLYDDKMLSTIDKGLKFAEEIKNKYSKPATAPADTTTPTIYTDEFFEQFRVK